MLEFDGRMRRRDFAIGVVVPLLFAFAIPFVSKFLYEPVGLPIVNVFSFIGYCCVYLLLFSLFVRRLHDKDSSGYLALLVLIPVVNWIVFFILLIAKGTEGDNKYESDPKQLIPPKAEKNT